MFRSMQSYQQYAAVSEHLIRNPESDWHKLSESVRNVMTIDVEEALANGIIGDAMDAVLPKPQKPKRSAAGGRLEGGA
ncbi:hypothetical protein HK097_008243 [Rhizophlyctis rosea]|uniref:Uncharacterized protein n=1 Tax=Rhizophlyctis rosea TaxID=64517 RepID=A0AAD5X5E1_9FUNG|nr:hypothetical protein HK097_008243 [Rhizophlyctis rosea]